MKRRTQSRLRKKRPKAPLERSSAGYTQYHVVELSTVDESGLERTLNEAVRGGWKLDAIHFAMRESSKRPAMAFVLFTREVDGAELSSLDRPQQRLAEVPAAPSPTAARQRLIELAGGLDDEDP